MSDERGDTLIELLISIVIAGIIVAALVGGLISSAVASGLNRDQSDVASVLASVGEAVKDNARTTYIACATAAEYQADVAGWTLTMPNLPSGSPWPTTSSIITIQSVLYWGTATGAPAGTALSFQSTCDDTAPNGNILTLQEVQVVVTSPDGRASQTRSFVKGVQ